MWNNKIHTKIRILSKMKRFYLFFSLPKICFCLIANFFHKAIFSIRLGQLNFKFTGYLLLLLLSLLKKKLAPEDSCNGRKKEMIVDAGLQLWILSIWAYRSTCICIITLNLFCAIFKKWQYEVPKFLLIIILKRKIIALPLFGMAKKGCVVYSLRFLCFSILYCFEKKSTFVIVHSCLV